MIDPKAAIRAAAVASAIALVPGTIGCGEVLCTAVGCTDAFVVVVDGDLPPEFIVLMDTDGQPPAEYTLSCTPSSCPMAFATEGSAPAAIEVRVLDATGDELARETYEPSYEVLYPNGKQCGPACRFAADTLTVG